MISTTKQINFIEIVVLFFYYLFCLLLFLSLGGLFNKFFILLGLIPLVLLIFIFREKINFSLKKYLWFFILIPLIVFGIILFKGFFSGDATYYWLPWAKEIVLKEKMPDFLLNLPIFFTSRESFLPLLFAATFTFLPFKEIFVAWIPILFCFLTVLVLYKWAKEKEIDKKYLIFAPLLFLSNPIFFKFGWDILQESLILFFFTVFFYLKEKYERGNNTFTLILLFFSFVLAIVSKISGLLLIIPLFFIFVKDKETRIKWWYLLVISLPIFVWLLRNYLIFDNPIFPTLDNIFKGKYHSIVSYLELLAASSFAKFNLGQKILILTQELILFIPFIIISFYALFKKKKFEYILLFLFFVFYIIFIQFSGSNLRYLYPLLGLLIIYFFEGLCLIKNKLFLAFNYFLAFNGLFLTKIPFSESAFIKPLEVSLGFLAHLFLFVSHHHLLFALIFTLIIYLLVKNREYLNYFLILIYSLYVVKMSTIQISWLNIWGPILLLFVIILIWPYLSRLKETIIYKGVIIFILSTLFLNSMGLASIYFFLHKKIVFPKIELYGIEPRAGEIIKSQEKGNKNFYIFVDSPSYLSWNYNFKVLSLYSHTFAYLTKMRYHPEITSEETHQLFKNHKIKYIIRTRETPFYLDFFKKIENQSELFKPILKENERILWQVY